MLTICIEDRCVKIPWSGCWIWEKALSVGYGSFRHEGKTYSAHRAAYEQAKGPIPDGLHILHECDIRSCCNPDHLFLGTNQDNINDSMQKGRRKGPKGMRGKVRPTGPIVYTRKMGPPKRLSLVQVAEIKLKAANGITQRALGKEYGVSDSFICMLLSGKRYAK